MQTDLGDQKLRAYVAVSRSEFRKQIVESLPPTRFDLKVGLQRSAVALEFKYFSPDIVFMDDKLFATLDDAEIIDMLASVPGDVPLVIYGPAADAKRVKSLIGSRSVYLEPILSKDHVANAAHRYKVVSHAPTAQNHERVHAISPDHPWSKIEVKVPARLTSLNPMVGAISLPYSMGAFTLARLEAPILNKAFGRHPQIKITDMVERASSVHVSEFTYHGHFYLADVTQEEQMKLSTVLLTMIQDYYQKMFVPDSNTAHQTAQATTIQIAAGQNHLPGQATHVALAAGAINGNLALKQPPLPPQFQQRAPQGPKLVDENISLEPETINTKIRREIFKDEVHIDFALSKWGKLVDWTLVKAVSLFLIAIAIMGFILVKATGIDESYYKDHGKEYSDFFLRMSNPSLRKSQNSDSNDGEKPSN